MSLVCAASALQTTHGPMTRRVAPRGPARSAVDDGDEATCEMPRRVSVFKVAASRGRTISKTLTPEPHELEAIADRLDVDEVISLEATVDISPAADLGDVVVRGEMAVKVAQECVVTGKPMVSELAPSFTVVASTRATEDEETIDEEAKKLRAKGKKVVERIDASEGVIDVGELVLQYLALSVDPYPRSVDYDTTSLISLRDTDDDGDDDDDGGGGGEYISLGDIFGRPQEKGPPE